jgi:hypothetical protein
MSTIASGHLLETVQVLSAERVGDAALGEQPAAPRLAAETREPRVRSVHGDAEAERDVALEWAWCCRGSVARERLGMCAAILGAAVGAARELRAEWSG